MMISFYHVIVIIVMCALVTPQTFFMEPGMLVGCFYDRSDDRDLPFSPPVTPVTVKTCLAGCTSHYYAYAGLQGGGECYCGGSYGKYGLGQCDSPCKEHQNTTCGGHSANSVYSTGFKVPGPPKSVDLVRKTSMSLYVQWAPPDSSNGVITEYKIKVSLNYSYHPDQTRAAPKLLRFSATTLTASINDLLPGTLYNVSISASSSEGSGPAASKLLWTEISQPEPPQPPKLLNKDGSLRVKLFPAEEHGGPITAYQVIVIDETTPTPFSSDSLYDYQKAHDSGITYWIAAQLSSDFFERSQYFTIGDGRRYGGYLNYGPLQTGHDYHVTVAVVSTLHGTTKRAFAKVSHDQHASENMVVHFLNHDSESEDYHDWLRSESDGGKEYGGPTSPLVLGLTVAIIVAAMVLIGAILVFVYLRHSLGAKLRRRRPDTQELTAQSTPSIDLEETGYIDIGHVNDAMRSAEDYLDSLKDKVWIIPKNFVELSHEVLGRGKFGSVMKGQVSANGQLIPCNTQVIANKILSPEEQKTMLRDLDLNIRAGQHQHLVCLVGICEEVETTQVVLEHAEPSMKQYLLDSRALLNYPEYASKNARFSTAREEMMLDLMVGLASGLDHLARCRIYHGRLCARNILMVGEGGAKISGFGLSDWQRGGERIDHTRWRASEALMNKQGGTKCDVWSFGCLLWEVATLGELLQIDMFQSSFSPGGTPYPDIRKRDVGIRVMRGLRLPQVPYISEELYQLMLGCWMTDPDERPSPAEVQLSLQQLTQDRRLHLNFSMQRMDFQYEPFSNELELLE